MQAMDVELNASFARTSRIGYVTSCSVIFYGLIAYYILRYTSMRTPWFEDFSLVKYIFWGLAVSISICIVVIHQLAGAKLRSLTLDTAQVIKYLQTMALVTFGLCESIGLLGILLVLITRNMTDYFGLAFLSLMAFSLSFPKFHRWKRYVQQAEQVQSI